MPESSRRPVPGLTTVSGAATAGLPRDRAASGTAGPGSHTPTRSSAGRHPPAAERLFHRGASGVPAFGNEWCSRNTYAGGAAENDHHETGNGVRFAPNFLAHQHNKAVAWNEDVVGTATRTRPAHGEGPAQTGGGSFTAPREGTGRIDLGSPKTVRRPGSTAGSVVDLPDRVRDGPGPHVRLPSATAPFNAPAYVAEPTSDTGYHRLVNRGTGTALDGAGTTAAGSTAVLRAPNSSTSNTLTFPAV